MVVMDYLDFNGNISSHSLFNNKRIFSHVCMHVCVHLCKEIASYSFIKQLP